MKTLWAVFGVLLCVVVASNALGADPDKADKADKADKLTVLEKKLVGAWIGDSGCAGNLVIQADGTYHHADFGPAASQFEVGTWKLEAAELPPTMVFNALLTEADQANEREETRRYVLKLNDEELHFRWTGHESSIVYEHRRGTEADNVAIRIAILSHAVQRYLGNDKQGGGVKLPPTLKALVETRILPTPKSLLDPWGKEFQYDVTGRRTRNAKVPDIWTVTPDKKIIGNWE